MNKKDIKEWLKKNWKPLALTGVSLIVGGAGAIYFKNKIDERRLDILTTSEDPTNIVSFRLPEPEEGAKNISIAINRKHDGEVWDHFGMTMEPETAKDFAETILKNVDVLSRNPSPEES